MKNFSYFPLMATASEAEGTSIPSYPTLSPENFRKAIEQNDVYLLDVRGNDEYEEAHIKGAHNLDVTESDFEAKARKMLPKDKTIAVYCRSGKRSAMAADILSRDGYRIINLEGGITNWTEKREPTVQS